jgi:hypothetical protein
MFVRIGHFSKNEEQSENLEKILGIFSKFVGIKQSLGTDWNLVRIKIVTVVRNLIFFLSCLIEKTNTFFFSCSFFSFL